MTTHFDPDPLYVPGPEPVIRERPRWPLILAIVVVIVAVFVVQIAASRREPGPASTAPTLSGTLPSAPEEARIAGYYVTGLTSRGAVVPLHMRPAAPVVEAESGSPTSTGRDPDGRPGNRSTYPEGTPSVQSEDRGRLSLDPSPDSAIVPPVGPVPDTATSVVGIASWFCHPPKYPRCTRGVPASSYAAAAGPALRVGDWRGRIVKVCAVGGRCVRVRLSDWCACPRRVVDLYHSAFAAIASPSRGVVRVEVTWGASTRVVLPPTDTTLHGETEG